jgi:hypothetical protein
MKLPFAGAIDCDLHPAVPDVAALMPYPGVELLQKPLTSEQLAATVRKVLDT